MTGPQRPPRRTPRPSAGGTPQRPGTRRPGPGGRPVGYIRLGAPRPRLRMISFALTLVMLAFVVRLLQVQAVDAGTYTAKAGHGRLASRTLSAERGDITDRRGVPLATTVDAYDIIGDPYLLTPEQSGIKDAPRQAAALLAPILDKDVAELEEKLSAPGSRYALLARRQSPQVSDQIKDLQRTFAAKAAEGKEANVLAGIVQQPNSKRVYPNKELAAGILGFVNSEGAGGGGLEAQLDKKLAGRDGKVVYAQSAGRQVPTSATREFPAVPGSDVELTIDRDIQWAAEKAITRQVRESAADRGYVIAMDSRTGRILALANAPGFDPNDISAADSRALGNPALQDAFEPGSTSKVMSMAAVLEEGAATPGTHVVVPNRLHRADRAFADDVDHATWHLTLNGVLAKSSNIGTILAVEQLGKTQQEADKILHSYLRKFGIGRATGLDFPGETAGILAKPEKWNASQRFTIRFGQGLSINAVQAASVYATIANDGVRTTPTLVRGTRGPDGRFVPAPEPKKNRVVSRKTAKTLSAMLESVVGNEHGTGTKARIPGYRVAGKTGTSNRVDPDTGRYHGYTASFAGFAPADKPRVVVYCAVQNPTRGSYFGGQVCGPVFREVMEFSLKSLQVPPTGKPPARLPVEARSGG